MRRWIRLLNSWGRHSKNIIVRGRPAKCRIYCKSGWAGDSDSWTHGAGIRKILLCEVDLRNVGYNLVNITFSSFFWRSQVERRLSHWKKMDSTGFEPVAFTLQTWRSTPDLRALATSIISVCMPYRYSEPAQRRPLYGADVDTTFWNLTSPEEGWEGNV